MLSWLFRVAVDRGSEVSSMPAGSTVNSAPAPRTSAREFRAGKIYCRKYLHLAIAFSGVNT
jgi:hypothetical protein